MREEWKIIPWLNGNYAISSLGHVRRVTKGQGARPWKVRATPLDGGGYPSIVFPKGTLPRRTFKVHLLVAEAFLSAPPSPGYEINHKNMDKTDNRACNLEWVTRKQNLRHAQLTRGSLRRTSPLSVVKVREIRASTETPTRLAKRFGVSRKMIQLVRDRKSWSWVS